MVSYKKYFVDYITLYMLLIFACIIAMAMQIVIPIFISKLGSEILSLNWSTVRNGCIVVFVCAILRFLFDYLWGHLNYYLSNKLLVEAEHDYVQKYFRKQYELINGNDFMYLSQRIHNDIVIIMDYYVEKMPLLCCHLGKLILIELVLFWQDAAIGIISLICILFIVVLFTLSRRNLFILGKNRTEAESYFFAYLSGRLSHVLEIKLDAKYKEIGNGFKVAGNKFVKEAVKYLDFKNALSLSGNFFTTVFLVTYILIAKWQYEISFNFAMAEIIVLSIFYFQQIVDDINYILGFNGIHQNFLVSKKRLDDIISVSDDVDGEIELEEIHMISGENICFDYGDKKLINNMNFSFEKGNIYGIVGKNGSGKSSLLLILLGILKPRSGVVKWNNIDINKINRTKMLKKKISVVPQQPVLLGHTIAACIFEENEVQVLNSEYSEMISFIEEKENGYNTKVYINGSNMSGGERQRITIIHSLLKRSDVLILDEPTSALDKRSIALLIEILQKERDNYIIIIISHDEEILKICDKRYVII